MEAYLRKIGLRHLKHIVGICKKHVTPLAVYRHKLMLTLLERLQSIGIVAFNPASLVKACGTAHHIRATDGTGLPRTATARLFLLSSCH